MLALSLYTLPVSAGKHTPRLLNQTSSNTTSEERATFTRTTSSENNSWQQSAMNAIQTLEYGFKKSPEGFLVANTKNGLHCLITHTGYRIEPMRLTESPSSWSTELQLESIGGSLHGMQRDYTCTQSGADLSYNYTAYSVVYQNTPSGLRQNFLIKEKSGNEDMLCVRMRVSSTLYPHLAGGRLLFSKDKADKGITLAYDDLHVWDAAGKRLPAYFRLSHGVLSIIADDAGAQYPITVDPLNHSPEWTTSASGLLSSLTSTQINSSLYGYSLSAVGDVNGDGYDDVAIGAPGVANIFTGTGSLARVGAVFIFRGSATGLSTTPSNILQPSTGAAGALFGFSIDGADANGDGKSDVVVGAPLDQVTVSAGVGTISGSVGKAYYYTGTSLTAATNPTTPAAIALGTSDLGLLNISNNALFGFSVAFTGDLNGDSRGDLVIGAPTYAGLVAAAPRTGGAYIFYSTTTSFSTTYASLAAPTFTTMGINGISVTGIQGLLFGYSVDGAGDYNSDGRQDVIVGAPAGLNLGTFSAVLSGQLLGGQAYIYGGTGTAVSTASLAMLQGASSLLGSTVPNLFGYKVRGLKTVAGTRNGSVLVSAPLGGTVASALSLSIKTGAVHVFRQKTSTPTTAVTPDQSLQTPRSSAILQVLNPINMNVLTGVSTDNMYDVNCDGYPDIVVGEPLSSSASILSLQTAAAGGNAYVFTGTNSGLFNTTPLYTVSATYDAANLSSVNAVALTGYSVAGGRRIFGTGSRPRMLVGAPAGALDFGSGLLNLGSTLGTLFSFTAGNNGPGKAYSFDLAACPTPLPIGIMNFRAEKRGATSQLSWSFTATTEDKRFDIYRNANGQDWSLISTVSGDAAKTSFAYTDVSPLQGNNYYQLHVSDAGQQIAKSTVALVHFDMEGDVRIYPIPITDNLTIELPAGGPYQLRIVDAFGRLTYADAGADGAAIHLSRNEAGMRAAGVYHLEISNGQSFKSKIIAVE